MDLIDAMASTLPLPAYQPLIRLHTISAPHEYRTLLIPWDIPKAIDMLLDGSGRFVLPAARIVGERSMKQMPID